MIPRVKGTQDFLDLTLFNYVLDTSKKHLATYNFAEIATPIVEYTELFKRTLGTHTDVVSKEMFIMASRSGDEEDSICLRPEATAPIVRAFIEDHAQTTPWKVFTVGPMFRYERPQKGRYRQFHQISMEIIGSASVAQDAQFIKMLDRLFHEKFKTNNYAVHINYLGCHSDRQAYEKTLKKFLDSVAGSLCANCNERKEKNVLRVFDCKVATCQKIYENAPVITDSLCEQCAREWQQLQDALDMLSVSYAPQPKLVRGLDYYTKTVFEFLSGNLGAQNAFCGGGRYDQLVSMLGGKEDQPSIGAAIGIERLMIMLELIKETLPLPQPAPLHAVLPLSEKQQTLALILADVLQREGLATEALLEGGSLKSMMRKANKLGAKFCLLLGDEEQQKNEVTIKNMVTSEEIRVPQVEAVKHLIK